MTTLWASRTWFIKFLFWILSLISVHAAAQPAPGIGERVAKQAFSLVSLAEMSNHAGSDPRCEGTPFARYPTRKLIDEQIVPMVEALMRSERKPVDAQALKVIDTLRLLPTQDQFKDQVVRKAFDLKLQEAQSGYGPNGACAAVASGLNVAIHQLQVWIRDTTVSLKAAAPR